MLLTPHKIVCLEARSVIKYSDTEKINDPLTPLQRTPECPATVIGENNKKTFVK